MTLTPASEAGLSDAILSAAAPLAIAGGGTRVRPEGARLSTLGLSGITLYEPGALTMVARAGTPLAEIETALVGEGQMLAFEPADPGPLAEGDGGSTIGGVFATNASGPRRVQAGAARDFLLGVRAVTGAGEIIKNGGRVMKNVTGYDLVKLMAGAHGTLGVLSEVSFKVLPRPETAACLLLHGLDEARAVAAMSAALATPYEVSGAAHLPVSMDGPPVTMLRLEGFEASVAYRLSALAAALSAFGPSEPVAAPDKVAAGWGYVRDLGPFAEQPGDLWRLSLRPSQAAGVVARAGADRVLYDWGGARVWVQVAPGTDLRARLGAFNGHATLIRGSGAARLHPEPAAVARISAGLRAQFDPRNILNRGLMG